MKSKFTHLLRLGFLALLALIAVWSCSKFDDFPLDDSENDALIVIQNQFNDEIKAFSKSGKSMQKSFRQSLERELEWDLAQFINDTLYVPISLILPENHYSESGGSLLNDRVWLQATKEAQSGDYHFKMLTVFPDSLGNSDNFDGLIVYEDYFVGSMRVLAFENGVRSKKLNHPSINRRSSGQAALASSPTCGDVPIGEICIGDPIDPDAPLKCYPALESVCDDRGGGAGGGGGVFPGGDPGGLPPGLGGGGSNPKVEKQAIVDNKHIDDCDGVKLANLRSGNSKIAKAIDDLKNKTKEFGAEITLSEPTNPNSVTIDQNYIEGTTNNVKFTPTWNSKNGHTVGFIHNHPNGSAPSPSDLFAPANHISNMVNDGSISGLEMHTYMENYTSLVVSNGYVYTISMKYGHDFAAMKDGAYNREVENKRYHEQTMKYLKRTGLDPGNQLNVQEASEAALLNLYGNMVNIAKQKIGEENAKILNLDSNKRVKSTDPC